MSQSQDNKKSELFLLELEDLISRLEIQPALAYAVMSFKMHKMRIQKQVSASYSLGVLEHSLEIFKREMEKEND